MTRTRGASTKVRERERVLFFWRGGGLEFLESEREREELEVCF